MGLPRGRASRRTSVCTSRCANHHTRDVRGPPRGSRLRGYTSLGVTPRTNEMAILIARAVFPQTWTLAQTGGFRDARHQCFGARQPMSDPMREGPARHRRCREIVGLVLLSLLSVGAGHLIV